MSDAVATPWSPPAPSVVTPQSAHAAQQAAQVAGREAGFEQGLQQGIAEGRLRAQTLIAEVEALLGALRTPFNELEAEIQPQLLGLVVAIAEAVVGRELSEDKSAIEQTLTDAIEALGDTTGDIEVVVNPVDRAMTEDLLEGRSLSIALTTDANLARGGCRRKRGSALVEATIEARIQAAIASLAEPPQKSAVQTASNHAFADQPLSQDDIAAIAARFGGKDATVKADES